MGVRYHIEAGNSNINLFKITSNYGPTENFGPRCPELVLYESLFDSTVRASAKFVDAGYNSSDMTAEDEEYNLTSGEKAELKITDSYENELDLTGDYQLRIRKHQREQFTSPKTTYVNYFTDFYSKESMENHLVTKRATRKYDGFPHEHINTLLTEDLGTSKVVEVDNTIIPYNFLGYSEKVFHHCVNLCNKGCPEFEGNPGILAGYLFYEVFKGTGSTGGYRYKSIDLLMKEKVKKKYIYTNTDEVPEGYDSKVINYYENVSSNAESEILSGATFKRELRRWDPYLKQWEQDDFDYKSQEKEDNNAGKEFHKIASDLNLQDQATRYSTRMWDASTIPKGSNWKAQKPFSKIKKGNGNYNIDELVRQSADRFNQLFGIQITILIPMDLSLHVGDLIFVDFPQIDPEKKEINKNRSGNYMIMDLGHRITPSTTYTSLHLSRDSTIYRK